MESKKIGAVTPAMVGRYKKAFAANPANKMAMNAVSRGNLNEIALNRDALNRVDMTFSLELDSGGPITDQARSGTCWLYAGLNWLRTFARKKLKAKHFTFSENHAVFWDKFEKANYFFENILALRDRDLDDRHVHHLLENPSPDGGEWNMVVNVIEKYGLIPRALMPDTFNRINSRYMNFILNSKLREGAALIRKLHRKGKPLPALRKVKEE
jgi:bleomycin hydrolase